MDGAVFGRGDPVSGLGRVRAQGFEGLVALDVDGGAAVDGEDSFDMPRLEEMVDVGFAGGFFVVVGTEAAGEPAEGGEEGEFAEVRIGGAGFEPAVGTGRDSGDEDAVLPGLLEGLVEVPFSPEGEEIAGASAADKDDVLVVDVRHEVGRRGAVEFEKGRAAIEGGAGAVESGDAQEGVTASGRDEADSGVWFLGEGEDVAVEVVAVAGVGVESSAADGEDSGM